MLLRMAYVGLLAGGVACGGKAVIDADGTGGGSGGTTGTTSSGPPAIAPQIVSAWAGGNCMPVYPDDPVSAGFEVAYDNSAGTSVVTATIASARLAFQCGAGCTPPLWAFLVTPPGSGALSPGVSVVLDHTKTAGSGSGTAANPCNYCGSDLVLEVVWDVDGATADASYGPFGYSCAF
ncbi:MAG: hypothetical protein IT373_30470 [Polyangiaceae bacterium]|nr:hypothetical protein [Polyangiaceae bacterium]